MTTRSRQPVDIDTVEVDGVIYYPATAVCRALSIARQTLWRWGTGGKTPRGRRYRDRQLLFTQTEVDEIRRYAHRIVPLDDNRSDERRDTTSRVTKSNDKPPREGRRSRR